MAGLPGLVDLSAVVLTLLLPTALPCTLLPQGFTPGCDVASLPGLVDLSAGRYAGVVPQGALGLTLGLAYAQMYGIR